MTKSRSHEEAKLASFRDDPEYASEYLNAVVEDGDQEELLETLRYRQVLRLEDLTEADLQAILAVEPSAESAAFDHEVTAGRGET